MRSFNGYDAVVFDCDGVLLDSNGMKVGAFRQSARKLGFDAEVVESFSAWQSGNFGLSRYVVFKRLLAGEFGRVPAGATIEDLLRNYADDVAAGYLHVPETDGARELIGLLGRLPLYVVSASDERELREVFRARGLAENFRTIYGSPSTKVQNLTRVRDELPQGSEILFVGDAIADADAASAVGMQFIFVSRYSLVSEEMGLRALSGEFSEVETLRGLIALVSSEAQYP